MTPSPAILYTRLMAGARFRHLQAFASVAELGSAKRAAEATGLTQPAVTLLVAHLEELLECALFQRHARGMRLTNTGRELLPFVQRAMASIEEGSEFVAFRRRNAHSIIRLGAIHGAICGLLVRALPPFGRLKPEIMVELQEADAAETSALISSREIDLMLCREPGIVPEGWAFSELMPDRLVVVAGPRHPLVGKHAMGFAELLDELWLMLPATTQAGRSLEEFMAQHGHSVRYGKIKTRSPAMVQALLQSEPWLALTPYSVMRQQIDTGVLAMLDVSDTPALQPLGILGPQEDMSEAAAILCTYLHRFVEQHP